MAEFDAVIAALLDEAVPRSDDRGQWERVLADARLRQQPWWTRGLATRRRRLAVFATATLVMAAIPLTALGVANDWWFLASSPSPAGPIVVVRSGRWNGIPWTLAAYRSKTNGLCLGLTPNPPAGRPQPGHGSQTAALACGTSVRGTPGGSSATKSHDVGYLSASRASSGFPGYVTGPAANDVTHVKVMLANGTTVAVRTFPAPRKLGISVRFYLARINAPVTAHTVIALDSRGHVLERLSIRQPKNPRHGSAPNTPSVTVTVGWG